MNEEAFRQRARMLGYRDIQFKDFAPNMDGPLHVHDFSVMVLVVSGEFWLGLDDGTTIYPIEGYCELAAGVSHAERTGKVGARALLAKMKPVASQATGTPALGRSR
jgi:quercetin dioxygenase-like cupin family protein